MKTKLSVKDAISDFIDTSNNYYASLNQIEQNAGCYPFIHQMKRAWEAMTLDGIYCINKRPVIYFKYIDDSQLNYKYINSLHKKLWNQGVAPILVVVSKIKLYIFSAFTTPCNPRDENHQLKEIISYTANSLKLKNLIDQVRSGRFYREHKNYFNQEKGVDKYLLDKLEKTRDILVEEISSSSAFEIIHAFLGKIIFTCYLVDRKIIKNDIFENAGAIGCNNLQDIFNKHSWFSARDILYTLFEILQEKFNGNMFSPICEEEKECLNQKSINTIKQFLNGEDINSIQPDLFSWPYDFEVISIETISAIYEKFLSAEGEEGNDGQQTSGAFYTPRFLVEMVVDIATEKYNSLLGRKFLDPACGSGIFLVVLFNRIAEEWGRKNPNASNLEKAEALLAIIRNQLCGVDIKQTACRITCFSLYLSMLDQLEPKDISLLEQSRNKVLENFLALKKENWKNVDIPVIIEGSFFDSDIPIGNDFDIVIGNPPWVSRGNSKDLTPELWYEDEMNPFFDIIKGKQRRKQCFQPLKEISTTFMWKVPLHIKKKGHSCLLLPAKILFNNSMSIFQQKWFSEFHVNRIFQLADWHNLLFENANCPSIIVEFDKREPQETIDYISPKVNWSDPRRGVISIYEEDCKKIKTYDIEYAAKEHNVTQVWKKPFWGSNRDIQLIDDLNSLSKLSSITGKPKEKKIFIKGQGYKPYLDKYYEDIDKYGLPKSPCWNEKYLYLDANKKFNWFIDKRDLSALKHDELYRNPDIKLYNPPMLITNQGFSKLAFCQHHVVFQHALQSITVSDEFEYDAGKMLKFILCLLKSKLAFYFFFYTSANWGTERNKILLNELLEMPFMLPDKAENKSKAFEIIDKINVLVSEIESFSNSFLESKRSISDVKYEVDDLIYEYYGLTDRQKLLVEDTFNIFKESSSPTAFFADIPTLKASQENNFIEYAKTLQEQLNSWLLKGRCINVQIIYSKDTAIAKLKRTVSENIPLVIKSKDELKKELDHLNKVLPENHGSFEYQRTLTVFDGDIIYIQKQRQLRFWTKSTALNDADEIAGAILSARHKKGS